MTFFSLCGDFFHVSLDFYNFLKLACDFLSQKKLQFCDFFSLRGDFL